MKKAIIFLIISIIFVIVVAVLKFAPLGTKEAVMGANITTIEVPKFSTLEEECCEYKATFKTFRSVKSIRTELKKMVEKYMELDCNGKKVYYDMTHDITIFEYEVEKGTFFNTFYIEYNIGQTCE